MYFSKLSTANSSKTFRIYLKDFSREPLSLRLYVSLQIDEIKTLSKMFLRIATVKIYWPQSRTHVFITQSLFNEHLSVVGYRSQNLQIILQR